MVYYGAVSRGCQRCRHRKVKCDERKPGCLKCQKSGTQCPGYRDLKEVLFRNESDRIIRKLRKKKASISSVDTGDRRAPSTDFSLSISPPVPSSIEAPPSLSPALDDLAANFFFTKYLPKETLIAKNFHNWLEGAYRKNNSPALSAIVQSVGMAGLSNVSPAPNITMESHRRYHHALWNLKQALDDPLRAVSDETLTTVNLLSLYEIVNSQSISEELPLSHTEGAMTLLELRGQSQYTYERGGHLVTQTCSRVLPICMQQKQTVPFALVRATSAWQSSPLRQEWGRRKYSHPGSLSEISFRLVNLRAFVKNGQIPAPHIIRRVALEIDHDLQTWEAVVPVTWKYTIVDRAAGPMDSELPTTSHIYPNLRIAEEWNNMRIQRIAINQILLRHSDPVCISDIESAIAVIRRASLEICTSVSSLRDSPRSISLIMPLYIISNEKLNSVALRRLAVEELRYLGAAMGFRKAGLLAECAATRLDRNSSKSI